MSDGARPVRRAAVLGAGSWGTALGNLLAGKDIPTMVWDIDPDPVGTIHDRHENVRYLPGVPLAPALDGTTDLATAVDGADLVVVVVPSPVVRAVLTQAAALLADDVVLCSATKGIETDTLMTMSEVMEDVLGEQSRDRLSFLSGPSFAIEVAQGLQTAVTIASTDHDTARGVQQAFHTPFFRPYTSTDVVGVEIGGCTKNVIAIATGMADGLGQEANARAALITRGLAEIARLGLARGAQLETLTGLACMGDLVLTCSSEKSRNYRVGFGLGQGRSLEEILADLGQVAEGVINARSVHGLAERAGVEMPISDGVYRLLNEGLAVQDLVAELTGRALRSEH